MEAVDLKNYEPQLILCPSCGDDGTFEIIVMDGFEAQARTICKGCKRTTVSHNLSKDSLGTLLVDWAKDESQVSDELIPVIDLDSYDTYVVGWSGGKDSLACILFLLEAGVPKEKIEL